jgi:hypothetical protein
VVTGQGVELGGDEEASQADGAGPADFRVQQSRKGKVGGWLGVG